MNILIVTHEFPPLNLIGAQRPYSWAKYWSRMGHNIYVLTTKKEAFDGPIDNSNDFQNISNVFIEEVKYWPFSTREDTSFSSEASRHEGNSNKSIFIYLKSLIKRIRQQLGVGAVFSVRNLWIRPAVKRGIDLHSQYKFDFIISTYGPPAPHFIASKLAKKLKLFWVADYRDLWSGTHYQGAEGLFSRFQDNKEKHTLSAANLITTVSKPLQTELSKRLTKNVIVIENGFDAEELPPDSFSDKQEMRSKVRLVYTGKVRGGKQVVKPLFDALAVLTQSIPNLETKLEILFYGLDLGEVPRLTKDYHFEKVIKFCGFLLRKDILNVQRGADALLFLDWKDTSIDGILTGKIFEYLYSGNPILGIGSYNWLAPGKILQDSGCGMCLGVDISQIAATINQLIIKREIPYNPRPAILQKYTRQALAENMLDKIVKAKSEYLNT